MPCKVHLNEKKKKSHIWETEIKMVNLKLPTKKTPGLDCFNGDLWPIFKEEIISILLKFFQKIDEKCGRQSSLIS